MEEIPVSWSEDSNYLLIIISSSLPLVFVLLPCSAFGDVQLLHP